MAETVIFIDAGYMIELTLRKKKRVDFAKLSDELSVGSWKKTYVYNALPSFIDSVRYRKTQRFHSALQKLDKIEVKLGRLQYSKNNTPRQKGVDVKLAVDLVQMSMNRDFSHAILITGDSDFQYAVEKSQECDIHVTLAYFAGSTINSVFRRVFDNTVCLDDAILDKCKL
ncbi:MAG: NYN domain-containing protein [Nitrosopumilus sp. H13]|nr:MAG: NYN domain-containing protein [Nitrosopumilus sp. H13]